MSCYIHLMGGLGNQLFQIAAAYAHCRRNGLTLQLPAKLLAAGTPRSVYWTTFAQRCAKYLTSAPPTSGRLWREPHFRWAAIPPQASVLHGYFQSSKYFKDVSGEIQELFTPADHVRAAVREKYAALLAPDSVENSVVVHVRRTDYLKCAAVHAVTTTQYYERAIQYMKERIPGAHFVVFSDDLEWCKTQSVFPAETIFVDEPDDSMALWLMSHFRYYIIANSSFSWWATWLNEPARIVVAPDRWFGPAGPQDWQDIYEEGWIKIACA